MSEKDFDIENQNAEENGRNIKNSEATGGQAEDTGSGNPQNTQESGQKLSQDNGQENSGLYGNDFFNPNPNPKGYQSNPYNSANQGNPYNSGNQGNPYNSGNSYNPYNPYSGNPYNPYRQPKPRKPKNPYTLLTVFVVVGLILSLGMGIVGMVIGSAITSSDYEDKLAKVNQVINIQTNTVEKNPTEAGTSSWVFEECRDSVVAITTNLGTGSGVFVSVQHQNAPEPYAYIITANHVVSGATSIKVQTYDGREYVAESMGGDAWTDIALIRIVVDQSSVYKPKALATGADYVNMGEEIVVIGNPLGELTWSVSTGVVSGLNREVYLDGYKMNLMQIDAAINPGNSGGAVFDMYGNLVAIVNAKTVTTGVEGIGYAIPSPDALNVINHLLTNGGYVSGRPYLGIGFVGVNNVNVASAYQFSGYMITSYAFGDQLKEGDLLVSIDGTALTDASQIIQTLSKKNIGDSITFTVIRLNTQTNTYPFATLDVTVTIHSIDDYYNLG